MARKLAQGFSPIILLIGVFAIAGLMAGGAFYIKRNYPPSQQEVLKNRQNTFKQTQNLDREEVFSKITKNSWGCVGISKGAPGPDFRKYSFKADGTYSVVHITDYPTAPVRGKWNFEKGTNGDWFLLYDSGERLRFAFKGNKLILENSELEACNDVLTVSNPYTAATLPKVQLSIRLNSMIDVLTAHKWKRANDFDTDYEPTSIEFKKNWEYISIWRNGECQNSGNWSLQEREVKGSSLTDKCDPRDDPYPESFRAEFLDDDKLLLKGDLYVPEHYLLKRGVIWSVSGYSDVVNIKVEYDMPVRAGVPNKFDIEMINVGKKQYVGAITLQRFSITEDYVRDYRINKQTIASVKEIAGKDLASRVLQPGESYTFSLDVSFRELGKQSMYVNAFIFGSTQTWDTQQRYFINVK